MKLTAKLTPKQEAFCQAMADGMTQADAYRQAYDAKKMKSETVQNTAYQLMQNREITARVQELKSKLESKNLWTREQSVKTAIRAIEQAEANNKPLEMLRGVEVLNKMFGYDEPQKVELSTARPGLILNIVTSKEEYEKEDD